MKMWTTENGNEIPYKKLTDSHLINIVKYIHRKAENGLELLDGGGFETGNIDDVWVDSRWIFDEEVFEYFGYKDIIKELKRRKLSDKFLLRIRK